MFNNCDCAGDCLNQWLFLGASVKSFSANIGFAEDTTSITVELVEDTEFTCDGRVKKYIDETFNVQETEGADPGFFGTQINIIGRPVLFKFEGFEFAGIVSDWTEQNSSGGKNLYSVTIEAPTFLLSCLNIIVNQYNGAVSGVPNLANVYGLLEGSSCENLGGSHNYGNGMPWNTILAGLRILTSVINPPLGYLDYLQSNRIKYLPGLNGGFGLIREDDTGYILDLEELPLAPDYYRVNDSISNLTDIINNLAADASFDWYCELMPCVHEGQVLKVIKVRVIDRSIPPLPDAIDNFIGQMAANRCGVSSYEKGQEQRDDYLHSILIGPPKHQIYATNWTRTDDPERLEIEVATGETTGIEYTYTVWIRDNEGNSTSEERTGTRNIQVLTEDVPIDLYDLSDDIIAPFWGLNVSGNVITSYAIDFFPEDSGLSTGPQDSPVFFQANTWPLNDKFFLLSVGNIELSEPELIASLAGFDVWESYITQAFTQTSSAIQAVRTFMGFDRRQIGLHNLSHLIQIFNESAGFNILKPMHMLALRKVSGNHSLLEQIESDIRTLYEWVLHYAQQYYGRQFMVRVPDVCVAYDEETDQYKYNYEISDGGWNEYDGVEFSDLLDIPIPSAGIDFFRLQDGRIGAFCQFPSANLLNFDQLSEDDYGYIDISGGILWVRCDVNPNIVFGDSSTLSDPRVVITLPQAVRLKTSNIWVEKDGSIKCINAGPTLRWSNEAIEQWKDGIEYSVGATSKMAYLAERTVQPYAVAIPMINNKDTYGPWLATNGLSIGGQVRAETDSSLVPWNFGSMTDLDTVAQSQANEGVSNMYYSESGSVTIPGVPTGRIGDELLSVNGSAYISGQFDANSRVVTVDQTAFPGVDYIRVDLIVGSLKWVGSYGPIITNIQCSVGTNGITTTYNMTSFKKKFKKFSKCRITRMKELADIRKRFLNGT